MTKREMFTKAIEMVNASAVEGFEEVVAGLTAEIEALDRRAVRAKDARVASSKANEGLREAVFTALAKIGEPVTVTTLQKESPELAEFSNQKISYLLAGLKEDGRVVRTTEKKKAYYSVA